MTHQSARRTGSPARRLSRVLLVAKKTPYEEAIERNDEAILDLIASGNPSTARMVPAHEEHVHSLSAVLTELVRRKCDVHVVYANELSDALNIDRSFDLVVAVGGDGTVLDASHYLTRVPLLGVNSAPSSSHGHFCLATPLTLAGILEQIARGARHPLAVMRLRAFLDGQPVWKPALNEVFVEDTSGTSHYVVTIGRFSEEQMSDGMFFATPAGSTGWIRPYGAYIQSVSEQMIQYITRGPIVQPGSFLRLTRGLCGQAVAISVTSKMREGKLAIDGRRHRFPFPRGSELVIKPARRHLNLFVDRDCNQPYVAAQPTRRDVGAWH